LRGPPVVQPLGNFPAIRINRKYKIEINKEREKKRKEKQTEETEQKCRGNSSSVLLFSNNVTNSNMIIYLVTIDRILIRK
jgi:hypothetical protein